MTRRRVEQIAQQQAKSVSFEDFDAGPFQSGSGSYVPITNVEITINLTEEREVVILAEATVQPVTSVTGAQLGIRVGATDYDGQTVDTAGLGEEISGGVTATKRLVLAAGSHTIKAVMRKTAPASDGKVANIRLQVEVL